MIRTYPREAWVLQPSFKPVKVVLVKKYDSWSGEDIGDFSDKGKLYSPESMFDSKEKAIEEGRNRCAKISADLDKRTDNLCKKIATLDKAEGVKP